MIRLAFYILSLLLFSVAGAYGQKQIKLLPSNIKETVAQMTLQEKVQLIIGASMPQQNFQGEVGYTDTIVPGAAGITSSITRLGIPTIVFADGPAGLHISPHRSGDSASYYCTGFPVGTHLASTWNDSIIFKVGQAIGNEVLEYGVDVILGPGVNIMRNPLCGRNFEYYSEDPLLSGNTAAALINGIQSNGVGASIKHFVANNQEINRLGNDSRVSLRALREIYLKNFEIAIRKSQPWTLMTSYNYLNGRYTSEDKGLLTDVLRGELGFEGAVVTDWGAGLDYPAQVAAGNDMIQPGDLDQYNAVINAVRKGTLPISAVDSCVTNILELIVKTPSYRGYKYSNAPDLAAHAKVTREVASEGFVLLKNDSSTLPLHNNPKIALFGVGSYDFIAGGKGSGDVNKPYVVDLRDGLIGSGIIPDKLLDSLYLSHMKSERERMEPMNQFRRWTVYTLRPNEIQDSRTLVAGSASRADFAVITFSRHAAEGFDRHVERDFNLHIDEIALLNEVSREFRSAGKKVVVILNISGPVETASWRDKADALLVCWMPGQEGGNSVADALLGKVSPSGHLPMTFPIKYSDVPSQNFPLNVPETGLNQSFENFSTKHKYYDQPNIDYTNYTEDIFIGYRHYATNNVEVAYPFGFGLSYSNFEISDMETYNFPSEQKIIVKCKVLNTGRYAAKQVLQLYSTQIGSDWSVAVNRPVYELRGYIKTPELKPGESFDAVIDISYDDLQIYSQESDEWVLVPGKYRLSLGFDSMNFLQQTVIEIKNGKKKKVSTVLLPSDSKIFIEQ